MSFAELLKSEMEKRGLSNYRLAKISGVHQSTIANLLDGKKPQAETERKILEALGINPNGLSEQQKTPPTNEVDGIDESLLDDLVKLNPGDVEKVRAYIQGMLDKYEA